ncbi:unnamed protein product [Polarella glacialis]|uniref:Uncharacterized protein n=1 Tax=Polarella glacialis TaxID=89957 RepID=A0A813L1V1_POLGL|nr:unnamed protein product [Polarella glacialis]
MPSGRDPLAALFGLSDVERALSAEIQRPGDLESWAASQVKQAVAAALGAAEEKLATESRRHADELRSRFTSLEHGLGASLQRLSRLEAPPRKLLATALQVPEQEFEHQAAVVAGGSSVAA